MCSTNDVLSADLIRSHLSADYRKNNIYVLPVVDSTNTVAKEMAKSGASHGTLIAADEQTDGRGRMGRGFFSPKGSGLYMSIILYPHQKDVSDVQMLTVAGAVAVASSIEKITGLSPKIKWVNDLYLRGRKICGILAEAVTDMKSGSIASLVLGIGINCSTERFPEDIQLKAGSLGVPLNRNALAADILCRCLDMFEDLGNEKIIEEYRSRSLIIGKRITYIKDHAEIEAVALEISDNGNLVVRRADGKVEALSFGEVSIQGDLT